MPSSARQKKGEFEGSYSLRMKSSGEISGSRTPMVTGEGDLVPVICVGFWETRVVLSLSVMMLVLFWHKRRVFPWSVEPSTEYS